ncbi:MAG: hypothetical protein DRR08_26225 [Candidatus Parabeggiatoa sp. nov. 2]|nr:MAG: hypothetical protein B6247_30015 [Beggiatoa sp. 4572_84]RKZ54659.1 MAG: hypothetical protein DRR08_26225 [Gammaproteobacteria bacterium]
MAYQKKNHFLRARLANDLIDGPIDKNLLLGQVGHTLKIPKAHKLDPIFMPLDLIITKKTMSYLCVV